VIKDVGCNQIAILEEGKGIVRSKAR